jgi:3-hydroxybutyrate dehydrogenase
MLNGRTARVTGSTSGIGLGIARALAQAGCDIMLNGLPVDGGWTAQQQTGPG